MQQDLTDCYIYPGKLNLQDYPQPDPSPSQNNATFNNIDNPIPNQQVVYGGGHGDLDMRDWDNAQCQDHLGHELNFLRGLDFRYLRSMLMS